jgi:imidazoleglycerol-phosphate dehydratase
MARQSVKKRTATITRETGETKITVTLSIDGRGETKTETQIGMFNHFLQQVASHGLFDLEVEAQDYYRTDQHHLIEDTAICLGQVFRQALGGGEGITRMGHAIVPMDDALAMVVVDISGRGYAVIDPPLKFRRKTIGELESEMVHEFLESFAKEAKMNLHVKVLSGHNDHHKAEAIFKALGRALDSATRIDERLSGKVPSTKGVIEG